MKQEQDLNFLFSFIFFIYIVLTLKLSGIDLVRVCTVYVKHEIWKHGSLLQKEEIHLVRLRRYYNSELELWNLAKSTQKVET